MKNPDFEEFLFSEMDSNEKYQDMVYFITSYEIRRGEYEGNTFVIMKMNQSNFIIFAEYEYPVGEIFINSGMTIYGHDLLSALEKRAKKLGFI